MCNVSLRAGLGGKTGTATTPALRQARKAMEKSMDGGYTSSALLFYFILYVRVLCDDDDDDDDDDS